ncbi:MAG TPA: DUF4340 domain-containing protein [Chroococcales cyanobacterium]
MKANPLTIGLAVALLGLGAYYQFFEKNRPPSENPDIISIWRIEEARAPSILSLEAGDKKIVFERKGKDWHLRGKGDLPLDYRWESSYSSLLKPSAERKVSDNAPLKDYGLDSPAFRLTLGSGKEAKSLLLGEKNPAGEAYYAAEPGKRTIYLVSSWQVEGWKGLLDKPPVASPTPAQKNKKPRNP